MEEGNTSLSSSGVNAKTVYEKELDYNSTKTYTQYLGYDGKDFLDKSGHIINPNIFSVRDGFLSEIIVVCNTNHTTITNIIAYNIWPATLSLNE